MLAENTSLHKGNPFHKFAAFLLAVLPILHTYGWGQLDLGFIFTVFIFITILLKKNLIIGHLPKYLNIYLIYYLIIWLVEAIIFGDSPIPLGWIKIYVVFFTYFSCVRWKYFMKYYSIIAEICIVFLIFQNFVLLLFDIKIFGILTFIPWSFDAELAEDYLIRMADDDWRMSSFLIEPAECAQYLLPYLAIILFKKDSKNKWIKCCLAVLALLLLRSGNALIIVGVIIACYVLWLVFSHPTVTKWVALCAIGIIGLVGGSYYISSEAGQELLDRKEEVKLDGETTKQSGFQRIFRGYFVYDALNTWEKVIGANNKTLILQAQGRSSMWFTFGENDFYVNTFQDILIKTGIVGCIIFIIMLSGFYRKSTLSGKTIIITMSAISFIASFYLTYKMLICLFTAYKMEHKKN